MRPSFTVECNREVILVLIVLRFVHGACMCDLLRNHLHLTIDDGGHYKEADIFLMTIEQFGIIADFVTLDRPRSLMNHDHSRSLFFSSHSYSSSLFVFFCSSAGVEYIPAGSFSESVASTGVSVVASLRNAGGFGGGVPLTNQEIEEWLGDACNNIIKVRIFASLLRKWCWF